MKDYLVLLVLTLSFACQTLGYRYSDNYDARIVGGQEADISQYAHQISLRNKNLLYPTNPFTHMCGGSIIAANWIVTAAHCIIARVASQLMIVAGTNYRNATDGTILPVAEIIMHEYYNASSYDNDIALLRLDEPLPLNNFTIKAIELADTKPLDGAVTTITGWGTTSPGGTASDKLMAVQVPIVSNELCNEDYGRNRITDSMLCAGARGVGGKDACQGDSGGPLIIRNQLFGIVSWGISCALPNYPGVYASVPHLSPWVKEKLAGA